MNRSKAASRRHRMIPLRDYQPCTWAGTIAVSMIRPIRPFVLIALVVASYCGGKVADMEYVTFESSLVPVPHRDQEARCVKSVQKSATSFEGFVKSPTSDLSDL
jgi:hypothetical protein